MNSTAQYIIFFSPLMVWEGTVTCEYYDPASLAMATGLQGLWTWML